MSPGSYPYPSSLGVTPFAVPASLGLPSAAAAAVLGSNGLDSIRAGPVEEPAPRSNRCQLRAVKLPFSRTAERQHSTQRHLTLYLSLCVCSSLLDLSTIYNV